MTLFMREKEIANENYEKGKLEGKLEGKIEGRLEGKLEGRLEGKLEGETKERVNGIKNLIEAYMELNLDKEFIVNKVMSKYDLSKEDIEKYL